mmetsp:Transcript_38235/g.74826  ORF Transcript_38235/g.74826 Transcript_38235/m.74826 type:complete len:103 (-) Transcript_38235:42-350(-)
MTVSVDQQQASGKKTKKNLQLCMFRCRINYLLQRDSNLKKSAPSPCVLFLPLNMSLFTFCLCHAVVPISFASLKLDGLTHYLYCHLTSIICVQNIIWLINCS